MKFSLKYPLTGLLLLNLFLLHTHCAPKKKTETIVALSDRKETIEFDIVTIAKNLNHPWGMAFLPDGQLLLTERKGNLRLIDTNNHLSEPVTGIPEVLNEGQGGLQDVAIDPDFRENRYIYISYAEPGPDQTASTALARGELVNNQLKNVKVLFRQVPKVDGGNHFGSRIVFSTDGHIFLAMGERFKFEPSQDLGSHLGKIVRLKSDGSLPENNPFLNQTNARKENWSYGHRNIEAAAIDPATGKLWVAEMGPKGGDELNLIEPGKNYGWPIVSWGNHYDGKDIPDPDTHPEMVDAKVRWTPVISPSGMVFYTGDLFPGLKGNMLIGGLSAKGIVRVQISSDETREVGRIDIGDRTRDVEQAPDGSIYVLTDRNDGSVLKLIPKKKL